jgi:tRNA(adenine34) deaminase
MRLALDEAKAAAAGGEVPVGAVVTRGTEVLAVAHAEIVALRAAAANLGVCRLDGCDLWVTLEPCAMCAGAIALARIGRLYFAAPDPKGGAVLHGPRLFGQPTCHHAPEIYSGIGEAEAAEMLRAFFRERRG